MGKAVERIFLPLMQLTLPEIVDVCLPPEAVFHNLMIVSIRKAYAGHARKIMNGMWAMGQAMFTKCIIVVDEDCDVQDLAEVTLRVANNIDPERDIQFTLGPVDTLDHAPPAQLRQQDGHRRHPQMGRRRLHPPLAPHAQTRPSRSSPHRRPLEETRHRMTLPLNDVTDAPVKDEAEVTHQEIDAALDLSAQRQFSKSLALFQEMLTRAKDANSQRKILFGIVTCSTWLNLDATREDAIRELKQLSDFDVSHAFIVMAQATAYLDFGRAQEALGLLNENLATEVLQRADFQDWKYDHLFSKGRALVKLARYDEALRVFDAAHGVFPEGNSESEMLIERSNCLIALDRFEEAYNSAIQVLDRGDEDLATLAMQHLAECRLWQRRAQEALEWYAAIQKRLPCRLVQEERIQKGITNAMTYLERLHPQGRPS